MPIPARPEPLRVFAARIRALWDAGGHITRDAVKAALDELEA